jgi:hypothetical protein
MSRLSKYGIRELQRDFPNNKVFLEFVFDSLHQRRCSCGGVFSLRNNRKVFRCGRCHFEISPLRDTVFGKSKTSLLLWLHALLMFSNAKSGISAKQLERQLAVIYKCAWRMLSEIRRRLRQGLKRLSGVVESDGAYLGGRKTGPKDGKRLREALERKAKAIAAIERGGEARAQAVTSTGARPTGDFVFEHVEPGSRLMTDKSGSYFKVGKMYDHQSVVHYKKEYVRGDVHVNTVESFWSHIRRSVAGTHKNVSKRHMQSYLDAFVFHYNNRYNDRNRFLTLLQIVLLASKKHKTPSGS